MLVVGCQIPADGGNSAGQAAVYLAGRTRRVYLLMRGGNLAKGMSRYPVDQVMDAESIVSLPNTEVRKLLGEDRLDGVVVEDNRPGARRILGARSLFVFIGAGLVPGTELRPRMYCNRASTG